VNKIKQMKPFRLTVTPRRLHHLNDVQREHAAPPVDLAPPPLLANELQEGDDVALGEGELVGLLALVVQEGDAAGTATHTHTHTVKYTLL